MITYEELVRRVQEEAKLPRGRAIEQIDALAQNAYPGLANVENFFEEHESATGVGESAKRVVTNTIIDPLRLVATGADWVMPGDQSQARRDLEEYSEYYPSAARVPENWWLIGGAALEDLPGTLAGGYGVAKAGVKAGVKIGEKLAGFAAKREIIKEGLEQAAKQAPNADLELAQRISSTSQPTKFQLSTGARTVAEQFDEIPRPFLASDQASDLVGRIARAKKIGVVAGEVGAGALAGGLYNFEDPLLGAAVGGALGGAGASLITGDAQNFAARLLGKPISKEVMQNEQVRSGVEFLAHKVFHESPDITLTRFQNARQLNAALTKAGGQEIDPLVFANQADLMMMEPKPVPGFPNATPPHPLEIQRTKYIDELFGTMQPAAPHLAENLDTIPTERLHEMYTELVRARSGWNNFPDQMAGVMEGKVAPKFEKAWVNPPVDSFGSFQGALKNTQKSQQLDISIDNTQAGTTPPIRENPVAEIIDPIATTRPWIQERIRKNTEFVTQINQTLKDTPDLPPENRVFLARLKTEMSRRSNMEKDVEEVFSKIYRQMESRGEVPKMTQPGESPILGILKSEKGSTPIFSPKPKPKEELTFSNSPEFEAALFNATGIPVVKNKSVAGMYKTFADKTSDVASVLTPEGFKNVPKRFIEMGPNGAEYIRGVFSDLKILSGDVMQSLMRKSGKILQTLEPKEHDEFARAFNGLKYSISDTGELKLAQTAAEGFSPKVTQVAEKYFRSVWSRLIDHRYGVRPEFEAVLRKNDLVWGEPLQNHLSMLQHADSLGIDLKSVQVSPNTLQAYIEGKQFLRNDLRTGNYDWRTGPFELNRVGFLPIPNERAKILDQLSDIERRSGLTPLQDGQTAKPTGYFYDEVAVQMKDARLKQLEEQIKKSELNDGTVVHIPEKHFSAPDKAARDPKLEPFDFDTDLNSYSQRLIHSMMNKRVYDSILERSRVLKSTITKQEDLEYLNNYVYGLRGMKAFKEDAGYRRGVSKIIGRPISEEGMDEFTSNLLQAVAFTRLTMGPRFALANPTQPFITLPGFVSMKNILKAVGTVAADTRNTKNPWAVRNNAWNRARLAGALLDSETLHQSERAVLAEGKTSKAINWAVDKWPLARLAVMGENFNRVVAFEAFYQEALEKGFKPSKALVTFDPSREYKNDIARAIDYGVAGAKMTQFGMSKAERPTILVGGAHRRIIGQFKSFQLSYSSMMANLLKHDKVGAVKNLIALSAIAGPAAVPLYQTLRNTMMKTGVVLPNSSMLGALSGTVGFDPGIDITNSMKPFDVPQNLSQLPGYVAGPLLGPMVETAFSAAQEGPLATQTQRKAMKILSPYVSSSAEAFQAQGLSRDGTPQVEITPYDRMMRFSGLAPNFRDALFNAKADIQTAYEINRPDLIPQMIRDAQKKGIRLSKQDISRVKGQATRNKNRRSEPLYR